MKSFKHWKPEEVNKLKHTYSISTNHQLNSIFPGWDRQRIIKKAWKLGLKRNPSVYEPIFPSINEKEKAYIAGLFDGEGCIYISKDNCNPRGKSPSYKLIATITNCYKKILDYLKIQFGGNVYQPAQRQNQRICFRWQTNAKKASAFLKVIYPYLRIKKEEAKIAIEFGNNIQYGGKQIKKKALLYREKQRLKLKSLK